MDLYKKRKEYLEGMLGAESLKLDNIARFIMEKIEGKIKVENLKKVDICKILRERNYNPDPVLRWKEKICKEKGYENEATANAADQEETGNEEPKSMKDFDYLLGMPIWNLTMEKKDDILRQQKTKADELGRLKAKSIKDLWMDDLAEFSHELDKFEAKEKEDESVTQLKTFKAASREQGKKGNFSASSKKMEYMPTPDGIKVEPVVDPALVSKTEKDAKSKEKRDNKRDESSEVNLVDVIVGSKKMSETEIAEFLKNMDKKPVAVKKEPTVKGVKSPKAKSPKAKSKVKSEKLDMDENSNAPTATTLSSDDEYSPKKSSPSKVKREPKESKPKASSAKPAAAKTSKAEAGKSTITSFFSKKKKANSSEEEDDDATDCESIDEVSFQTDSPVQPRVISRQRKEVKYTKFLADSDEDTRDTKSSATASNNRDDSDSDVKLDDDDDSDVEEVAKKPKKRAAEASNAAAKKKKMVSESESEASDDDDDFGFEKKSKAAAKKSAEKPKEKVRLSVELLSKQLTLINFFVSKEKVVVNAFAKMKSASEAASKPKRAIGSDEDTENKPPSKKKTDTSETKKPAAKTTATESKKASSSNLLKPSNSSSKVNEAKASSKSSKKKNSSDDEDDFVIDDSDSDADFVQKKKPAKKKLLDKPSDQDFFSKKTSGAGAKKPKNAISEDDELYAID